MNEVVVVKVHQDGDRLPQYDARPHNDVTELPLED